MTKRKNTTKTLAVSMALAVTLTNLPLEVLADEYTSSEVAAMADSDGTIDAPVTTYEENTAPQETVAEEAPEVTEETAPEYTEVPSSVEEEETVTEEDGIAAISEEDEPEEVSDDVSTGNYVYAEGGSISFLEAVTIQLGKIGTYRAQKIGSDEWLSGTDSLDAGEYELQVGEYKYVGQNGLKPVFNTVYSHDSYFTVVDSNTVTFKVENSEYKNNLNVITVKPDVAKKTTGSSLLGTEKAYYVADGKDISFTVSDVEGLDTVVTVDEKVINSVDGVYTLSNITADATVKIAFTNKEVVSFVLQDGVSTTYTGESLDDFMYENVVLGLMNADGELITDEDGNPIKPDRSKVSFKYDNKAGEQTVTVSLNEDETYKDTKASTTVTINKATTNVSVSNLSVNYGDKYDFTVTTDPAGIDTVKIIAGIDGDATGFASIYLKDLVSNDVLSQVAYKGIKTLINGKSVSDLTGSMENINKIIDLVGGDSEVVEQILNVLESLPVDVTVYIDEQPENAGLYVAAAVTVDSNYETAVGLGYITIAPQTANIKLAFNSEFDNAAHVLSIEEAEQFNFGGAAVNGDAAVNANVRAVYAGTTSAGKVVSSSTPITEPGVYTETIYVLGGNYFATPIVRTYTVSRISTSIEFDTQLIDKEYDGLPAEVSATVTAADGTEFEASVRYVGLTAKGETYNSKTAPTDAGAYTAIASFAGNDMYAPSIEVTQALIIRKSDDKVEIVLPELTYTYGDTLTEESIKADVMENLGVIGLTEVEENSVRAAIEDALYLELNTEVGTYQITFDKDALAFIQDNYYKAFTITDGNYTIERRVVTVSVTEETLSKEYGEDDPDFEYVYENVVDGDTVKVTLKRYEGEEVGVYPFYEEVESDDNYGDNRNYKFVLADNTSFEIKEKTDNGEDQNPGEDGDGEDQNPGEDGDGEDQNPGEDGDGEDQNPGEDGDGEDQEPGEDGDGNDQDPGEDGDGEDQEPGEDGDGEDQEPGEDGDGEEQKPGEKPGTDEEPGSDEEKPADKEEADKNTSSEDKKQETASSTNTGVTTSAALGTTGFLTTGALSGIAALLIEKRRRKNK